MDLEETLIMYYIDDADIPYLAKVPVSPYLVTLADFKSVLNKSNYRFFFKSMDDKYRVVQKEISDDDEKLPHYCERVISWLVTTEGSCLSGSPSLFTNTMSQSTELRMPSERQIGIAYGRPSSSRERRVCDSCKPILHQREEAIVVHQKCIHRLEELLRFLKRQIEVNEQLIDIMNRSRNSAIHESSLSPNQENSSPDSITFTPQDQDSPNTEEKHMELKRSELEESVKSAKRKLFQEYLK